MEHLQVINYICFASTGQFFWTWARKNDILFGCCRNKAIADYLSSNGYINALAEFQKEADMVRSRVNLFCLWDYPLILSPPPLLPTPPKDEKIEPVNVSIYKKADFSKLVWRASLHCSLGLLFAIWLLQVCTNL